MLGKVEHTARGFEIIRFTDQSDADCTLQQSSVILDRDTPGASAIRIGQGDSRMHLSREQVASLSLHLKRWLDTGSFELNPPHDPLKCEKCQKNDAEEEHGCPYLEDVEGDKDTLCTCCNECMTQCADDI